MIEWLERTRDDEIQACEANPDPGSASGYARSTTKKGIDLCVGQVKKQPGPLKTGGNMAVPIAWDYRSVKVLHGTSSDARRKLLEHEAEDGWAFVTNVAIGDDENLVFKKSA